MGTGNLTQRADNQTITQIWYNSIQDALEGDVVPRDTGGIAGTEKGSLGNSSLAWLRAYISSGYFSAGDIKAHHSYNGTIPVGEGWMKCDGRQVTQAAYDTEHGAGHWNTYVVSSPLLNKYLPDLRARYLVGASTGTTTQTGAGAITAIGNTGHRISIAHSHTVNAHSHTVNSHTHAMENHAHGLFTLSGSDQQGYNSAGTASLLKNDASTSSTATGLVVATGNITTGAGTIYGVMSMPSGNGAYTSSMVSDGNGNPTGAATPGTDSQSPGTDTQLSASQSIQPESIEVEYYMRII